MMQVSLHMLGSTQQTLVNQVLNFAVTLTDELNIMLPPLTYEHSVIPDPVQAQCVRQALQHVLNTQVIPPHWATLIAAALRDVAEHLTIYDTEEAALRVSGIAPMPDGTTVISAIWDAAQQLIEVGGGLLDD